jgi:hypothetical protein
MRFVGSNRKVHYFQKIVQNEKDQEIILPYFK